MTKTKSKGKTKSKKTAAKHTCSKCGHVGPIGEKGKRGSGDFGIRTINGKDYPQSQCRWCRKGWKICKGCEEHKPANEKHFARNAKNGLLRDKCTACRK